MSYRFMRTIVFFDLPTETLENKRDYLKFRKALIKNGFIMLQESVYCRLLLNASAEKAALEVIRKHKPAEGLVQVLTITEKQFASMECMVGEYHTDVVDTDDRLVVL